MADMDETLASVVEVYQSGIPANQAVLYALFAKDGSAAVFIEISDPGYGSPGSCLAESQGDLHTPGPDL